MLHSATTTRHPSRHPDCSLHVRHLALGIDLEEFQPRSGPPGTKCTDLPLLVERLLEVLDRHQARATFFVVGETARRYPDLVAGLSGRGHEIASHGHRHLPLAALNAQTFAEDLAESLEVLNALCSQPVIGFRAPLLSLTADTDWAYAVMRDAGIRYSSSTFPGANVQYGWPDCPPLPHRRGGIVEYPLSVMKIMGRPYPAVGGAYIRIFPCRWIRRALEHRDPDTLVTSYLHPYDFDVDQPFAIHRELTRRPWLAPLLFYNRRDFLRRLNILLDHTDEVFTFSAHYTTHHEELV